MRRRILDGPQSDPSRVRERHSPCSVSLLCDRARCDGLGCHSTDVLVYDTRTEPVTTSAVLVVLRDRRGSAVHSTPPPGRNVRSPVTTSLGGELRDLGRWTLSRTLLDRSISHCHYLNSSCWIPSQDATRSVHELGVVTGRYWGSLGSPETTRRHRLTLQTSDTRRPRPSPEDDE